MLYFYSSTYYILIKVRPIIFFLVLSLSLCYKCKSDSRYNEEYQLLVLSLVKKLNECSEIVDLDEPLHQKPYILPTYRTYTNLTSIPTIRANTVLLVILLTLTFL